MILILGVSHGALDHLRGKKIFHPLLKKKWSVLFYPGYILLSLTVIFGWILFPVIALLLFLLVASYHFGEEDLRFFYQR
jgi:Brp/Blh family beta-carotene 15,15'-monooxygenase